MDAVSAIVSGLRARWPDLSRAAHQAWLANTGTRCVVCGWIPDGGTYTEDCNGAIRDSASEKTKALEAGLARITRVMSGDLQECRTCGGLFERTFSGPPAADSLFEVSVSFRRLAPAEAIDLVGRSEWWIHHEIRARQTELAGVGTVSRRPLASVTRTARAIGQVEVFTRRAPTRPYRPISILSYRAGAAEGDANVVASLRESAALLGADAIVMGNTITGPSLPVGPVMAVFTDHRATAIVYED
jgi:hypothetical protein